MEEKSTVSECFFCNQSALLRRFFEERLAFIKDNQYPFAFSVESATRLITHLIPEQSQDLSSHFESFEKPENYFIPVGENNSNLISDFNFDGVIFYSSQHEKLAYTQVFRDGKIETVSLVAKNGQSKNKFLPLLKLQKDLNLTLANHLKLLKQCDINGPYSLFIKMISVENLRIDPDDIVKSGFEAKGRNKAMIREQLSFPTYTIQNPDINVEEFLMPVFDILWNTFGFAQAPKIA